MKKETFFGLAMLSLAGCSTTSQQTAALDVQPLELESLKPEKIQPVKRVFAQQGYRLPRSSKEQFSKLLPVKEPRPGDLIFFRHGKGNVSHVGIYLGNQKMLHSPSPGKKVEITRIDQDYWKKRYAGARAVVQERVTVSR